MSNQDQRVSFSYSRLSLVAGNTFLEAVRQKLFNVFLLLAVGLVVSEQFFRQVNFAASELKFIFDFGQGALVFFGSALTITATAQLFFSEIEGRTALTLLAKPVWRTEFIFGKLLGVWAVVGVFCSLITGLLLGMLWYRAHGLLAEHPELLQTGIQAIPLGDVIIVGVLQWLKFGVLAAMTLLIASFATTNLYTVIVGFFVLVICHLQYVAQNAYAHLTAGVMRLLLALLAHIFPNFQLFNLADQIGPAAGVDPVTALRVAAYALVYLLVFGGLAVWSFRQREI